MTRSFILAVPVMATVFGVGAAFAQEFGQGPRRDLFDGGKMETTVLPQGKAVITGGERLVRPGGRSPWHTDFGAKLLYVLDGTMAVQALGGKTLMTCGPGPKLCLSSQKGPWFFRNAGEGSLKFVVIGMDPTGRPTVHEEVGQVTAISGNRVTLAVGDTRTAELVTPRKEITLTVPTVGAVAVGDHVVTVRHDENAHTAEGLVKLQSRWQ